MSVAVMSSKGQIVVPAELRRRAELAAGDRVIIDFDDATKELRLRKAESVGELIDRLAGRTTAWAKPGTPPLEEPREFYRTRAPRA